ncbi:MFS transporter [Paractinoplanes abujensis]|nr:MFS transporter [Actinoplanes abujensis]
MRLGLVLALGGLLVVVDTTVTVVAVPAMVAGLDSTLAAVQWVTTAYLLGIVAVIPLAGWASERFGARRVYLVALGVFTVFSVAAGLAGNAVTLAVFRALQGVGGGLLNPVGQAIGMRAVAPDRRGRLMAMLGLPLIVGPVLGPPLSGWLVDAASWRWVFLINLPVGALAMLLCARFLPREATPGFPVRRIDWAGLALLPVGGTGIVLGCTLIPHASGAAFLAAGLLLVVVFVVRAVRVAAPLVDVRLFKGRLFATGVGVLTAFGAAYFGALTVLPLFVQGVRGDPAALAGALGVPAAIGVGVTVQVATRLVDRVAPRRVALTGVTLGLVAMVGLVAATTTNSPYGLIVAAATLLGVASGATILPTMTAAVRDLPANELPAATTLLALTQQLAAAAGVAVVATVLGVALDGPTGGGGVAAMLALDPGARSAAEADLAVGVGSAYGVGTLLMVVAVVVAVRVPQRVDREHVRQ